MATEDEVASPPTGPGDSGGMSASTPDGAGYSAQGSEPPPSQPDQSNAPPAASAHDQWVADTFEHHPSDSGPADAGPVATGSDGGMSGVTAEGVGYSDTGAAPDSSQPAPPAAPEGDGGMSKSTAGGAGYSAEGTAPTASVDTEKAAREQIAKDSTSGDPTTNADDVKLVNEEIAKAVPLKELEALKAAGVKVKVTTGGVSTYKPELNDNKPRGHSDGWATVAGVYMPKTKEVVIATHANPDGSRALPGQAQSSSDDVVAHEMAHAYNATGKDSSGKDQLLSDQDDFKDAYKQDAKTGKLADPYYHQKTLWWDSAGGRDEGFAESNAMYRTHPDEMKKQYPKLYDYWNKRLGQ